MGSSLFRVLRLPEDWRRPACVPLHGVLAEQWISILIPWVLLDEALNIAAPQTGGSSSDRYLRPSIMPTLSLGYIAPHGKHERSPMPPHMIPKSTPAFPAARLFSTSRPQRQAGNDLSLDTGQLPHLTPQSTVHQISVSAKAPTYRRALAVGHVVFSNPEPLRLIRAHALKKGDVLAVARVAAIMAVKKTSDIIPLAHDGIGVEGCVAEVELVDAADTQQAAATIFDAGKLNTANVGEEQAGKQLSSPIGSHGGIRIAVTVSTTAKTGVEMEALTGVMGAGLTVIDMCKAVDRHLKLQGVEAIGKAGGKSGAWGVYASEP